MQYQVLFSKRLIINKLLKISGSNKSLIIIDKVLTIWNAISGSIQQEVKHYW